MRIVVLNDGETFTDINGVAIYEIRDPNAEIEDVEEALRDIQHGEEQLGEDGDTLRLVGWFDKFGGFQTP